MSGKANVNLRQDGVEKFWTLYGVVEKQGDVFPLSEGFKEAFVKLAERMKSQWESRGRDYRFNYRISPQSVTLDWIKKQDAAWRSHVEMFWLACD